MRPDVSELNEFYATPIGGVARRLLAHRIRSAWNNVSGETLLGIGYAAPFMRQFRSEARRQLLCMPEEQGAVRWPREGPVCSFLGSDGDLPLPPSSIDRILAVHCLEHSGGVAPLLREFWRVLTPEGRLMLVVPNRRGVWARMDSTPFGHGRPYSRGQVERLLSDCLYAQTGCWPALFMPPVSRQISQYSRGLGACRAFRVAGFLRRFDCRGAKANLCAGQRQKSSRSREISTGFGEIGSQEFYSDRKFEANRSEAMYQMILKR